MVLYLHQLARSSCAVHIIQYNTYKNRISFANSRLLVRLLNRCQALRHERRRWERVGRGLAERASRGLQRPDRVRCGAKSARVRRWTSAPSCSSSCSRSSLPSRRSSRASRARGRRARSLLPPIAPDTADVDIHPQFLLEHFMCSLCIVILFSCSLITFPAHQYHWPLCIH